MGKMHEREVEGEVGNWKQIVVVDHIPLDDCFVGVVESSLFEKENSDILLTQLMRSREIRRKLKDFFQFHTLTDLSIQTYKPN